MGVKQCHPNKKMALFPWRESHQEINLLPFGDLLFSLPVEFWLSFGTSLVTPVGQDTKGTWRVFGTAEPLQYRCLLWQSLLPWFCRAIVNTSFAFPLLAEKVATCCTVIWKFLSTPFKTCISLAFRITPSESVFHLSGRYFPLFFLKSPLACWLGKTSFELQQVLTSGLPGCAVFWDAKLL